LQLAHTTRPLTACLNSHQFSFFACRRRCRRCLRRRRCIRLAASATAAIIHSAAAILVVRSRRSQPLSAVTWIVLLESIYRIIQVFFCIFPMSQESIRIRFPMSILDHFIFPKLPIFLSNVHIPRIRIFSCFSSFRQVHLHLSPTAN
jgi:hypothetical protein